MNTFESKVAFVRRTRSLEKEKSSSEMKPDDSDQPNDSIPVHPLSSEPNAAWAHMTEHENRQAIKIPPLLPLSEAIRPDHVRFVCISDTHGMLHKILDRLPPGDILIHAGDFTNDGKLNDAKAFNEDLGKTKHKHRIVIAGNHELGFDNHTKDLTSDLAEANVPRLQDLLTNCTYLEDESVTLYGIKIYGSPWQPHFGGWAFNVKRGRDLMEKWERIPTNTDVLVIHGPPVGHGDFTANKQHAGCVDLLNVIEQRVKPRFNIFGHIHEGYGLTTNNQGTIFINASICTRRYVASNDPIIFDLPLPPGMSK